MSGASVYGPAAIRELCYRNEVEALIDILRRSKQAGTCWSGGVTTRLSLIIDDVKRGEGLGYC